MATDKSNYRKTLQVSPRGARSSDWMDLVTQNAPLYLDPRQAPEAWPESPHLSFMRLDIDSPYGSPCSLGSPQMVQRHISEPVSPALLSAPAVQEMIDDFTLSNDEPWLPLDQLQEQARSRSPELAWIDFYPNTVDIPLDGMSRRLSSKLCHGLQPRPAAWLPVGARADYFCWGQVVDANTIRYVSQAETVEGSTTVGLHQLLDAVWPLMSLEDQNASRGLAHLLVAANWQMLRLRASCLMSARAAISVVMEPANVESTRHTDVLGNKIRSDVLVRLQQRWENNHTVRSALFMECHAGVQQQEAMSRISSLIESYCGTSLHTEQGAEQGAACLAAAHEMVDTAKPVECDAESACEWMGLRYRIYLNKMAATGAASKVLRRPTKFRARGRALIRPKRYVRTSGAEGTSVLTASRLQSLDALGLRSSQAAGWRRHQHDFRHCVAPQAKHKRSVLVRE